MDPTDGLDDMRNGRVVRQQGAILSIPAPQGFGNAFHWVTVVFFFIMVITVISTWCLAVVFGLNSLSGVTFLSNWIVNFNIMYMSFSLASLAALCATSVSLRYNYRSGKPWQFDNELMWINMIYAGFVAITVIPLATYAFNVGNLSNFCTGTSCDVHAYVMSKTVGAVFWSSTSYIAVCVVKFVFLFTNSNVDTATLSPAEANRILARSGAGGAPLSM